jgi:2-desacetyl-2-hydroxyethyl bacteriochlorophyllide A dehydrogenase
MTARALWFTGERQIELREEELPAVGKDEVRIAAIASLVSAGTEMTFYRGQAASGDEMSLPTMTGTLPFPVKYAYQVVGRVEEAGSESGFTPGEMVFAAHPHQDHFVMKPLIDVGGGVLARMVHRVVDGLTPQQAAFTNMFGVAYGGLLEAPVRIGDVVAVSGLGVIGTFAAVLARRTAGRLLLIDPLPERRERVAWIEADAVVHPDEAGDAIAELSEGVGADLFFEASGAPAGLQKGIELTGAEGTIVVISYFGGREVALRLSPEYLLHQPRIVTTFAGGIPGELTPRWTMPRKVRTAMELLADFDVERLVTHRVPFGDAASAYRLIDENPRESLGVLLEY